MRTKEEVDAIDNERPLCTDRDFAKILAHAVQMAEHVTLEVDENQLENANVTLDAEFVIDALDALLAYALRYEGEVFQEVHDQLVEQYHMIREHKSGFGKKTEH